MSQKTNVSINMLDLPDCVYLTEHCRCEILQVTKCRGKECTFRQIVAERRDSEEMWLARMNSLSEEKQLEFAKIYYGGTLPWREGENEL